MERGKPQEQFEEGEISDSASASSVEEITEDDFFNKHDIKNTLSARSAAVPAADLSYKAIFVNLENNSANNFPINHKRNLNYKNVFDNNNNNNNNTNSINQQQDRSWNKRDMYEYYPKGGGHNLAWASWASAVKSKSSDFSNPKDEIVQIEIPKRTEEIASLKKVDISPENFVSSNIAGSFKNYQLPENCGLKDDSLESSRGEKKLVNAVVIDIDVEKINVMEEKEEKEEGELEEGEIDLDSDVNNVFYILEVIAAELELKSNSILKGLENADVECAEKSFKEVYSLVEELLESLHNLVDEISLAKKDDHIQLLYTAIKSLQAVFPSMSKNRREEMGKNMKSLVASLKGRKHSVLSTEQLKEMELLVSAMHSSTVHTDVKAIEMNIEMPVIDGFVKTGVDFYYEQSFADLIIPMEISDESEENETVESSRVLEVSSKYKDSSLQFLDLHKDHDAGSLPSPTRDAPYILPISKAVGIGGGNMKPKWPLVPRISSEPNAVTLHPSESDAVKHTTYQQKFSGSSNFVNDELPSPTPSEDGDTANGGDISGDISSSLKNVYAFSTHAASTLPVKVDYHNGKVLQSSWCSIPMSMEHSFQPKQSTTRNRDPRLRFVSSDGATFETLSSYEPKSEPVGLRKQKIIVEPIVSQPALKKLKHEFVESQAVPNAQTVTGSSGWQNDAGTAKLGVGSSGSTTPNVTMEQRESTVRSKSTTQLPSLNLPLGSVPLISSITPSPSVVMKGSSGTSQVVTHTTTTDDSGIIRMKLRDPRRVLHNNTLLKCRRIDDQSLVKTCTPSVPGRACFFNEQRHEGQPGIISLPTFTNAGPDFTSQFTKNLQNISDIVFVSQAASSRSSVSHVPASQPQPAPAFHGRLASSVAFDSVQTSTMLASREASTVSTQPHDNNWGDVEHLFNGFDDQQKEAIQRERARRMEEQRKMFASRKLCLVLDLDHTLLNSAKFEEVELQHHEMLKKMEEEDREKPQRNLYRLPHMQMWTKLRPGIWNFLERASKLYELHLYTMGNKIYATEMAKLLDPKGDLFAGRVISRGDDVDPVDVDEMVPRSKDLEGVLGMESSVVIIDDSIRVWPHNKLNMIVVERYLYFPNSRYQFGLSGPSLLEYRHDERVEDGTLASSLSVIERIHSNFFSHQSLHEADVRSILASEQRKILAGCRVVFSRIIPVGESKPHLHPLWQTAQQFGAVCTNSLDDQVTHVVAYSPGTEKVNWALSHRKFVVRPGWVEASALLYRRANEYDHLIKP